MKVAYIFSTTNAQRILDQMIIPQLLEGRHGADVVCAPLDGALRISWSPVQELDVSPIFMPLWAAHSRIR